MTIPTITPLPQAPQVTDAPSVFSQRANTFVAALAQLVTETNATTAEINQALAGALVLFDGYKGDWEAGSYGAGDVVRKDGEFYISLVDSNTQEPPGNQWQDITSYTRNNILGTVSESAGVPTGAIIERGSNVNGEFVMFADGTQICTATVGKNNLDTSGQSFSFARGFTSNVVPSVSIEQIGSSFGSRGAVISRTSESYAIVVQNVGDGNLISSARVFDLIAIGRWF